MGRCHPNWTREMAIRSLTGNARSPFHAELARFDISIDLRRLPGYSNPRRRPWGCAARPRRATRSARAGRTGWGCQCCIQRPADLGGLGMLRLVATRAAFRSHLQRMDANLRPQLLVSVVVAMARDVAN